MAPLNVPTTTNSRPPSQAPMKAITLPFRDTPYELPKWENEIEWNARATASFPQEQEVENNGSASNVNPRAFSQNRLLPMRSDASDKDGQDPNSRQATSYEFGESTAVPSRSVDSTPLLGLDSRSKELGHTTNLPLEIEESFSDLAEGNKPPSAHYRPVPEQSASIRGGFLEVPPYISALSAGSQVSDGGQQDYINQQKRAIAKQPAIRTQTDHPSHAHVPHDNIEKLLSDAWENAWSLDGRQASFLPIGEVDRLITKEAVYRELCEQLDNAGKKDEELVNQLKEADLEELAGKICHDEPLKENPLKYQSFRKTFVILVLAGKSLAIKQFIDDNISDLDLPLAPAGESYPDSVNLRRRNNKDAKLNCFNGWQLNERDHFASWHWRVTAPYFSLDEFKRVRHFSLLSGQILPFINSPHERKYAIEGGMSHIYMIDIHSEHHNFHQKDSELDGTTKGAMKVAIKEIKQQENKDEQLFQIEARALRRFRHKHVVKLLATYEQFNRYYLMFPRADADLIGFWKKVKLDRSYNDMFWLAKQCVGMADALVKLHHATFMDRSDSFPVTGKIPKKSAGLGRQHSCASTNAIAPRADEKGAADDNSTTPQYRLITRRASTSDCRFVRQEWIPQKCGCYREEPGTNVRARPNANDPPAAKKVWGRHGDIKPQNILWYSKNRDGSSLGTLKLADFGQAELNSQWSRSKHRGDLAHSPTYRAPEFDIPPYITHASYDIWSLGCVYLESVAWMIRGYNAVKEFAESRVSSDKLMQEDTDAFFETSGQAGREEAKLKPCVKDAIKKLRGHQNCTDYLNDFLSFIENEMLVVDYQKRGSCIQVQEKLSELLQKGKRDVGYMCQPRLDSEAA